MSKPKVLVLRAPGTNCDEETAFAFELVGASAERVHVNRLLDNPRLLSDYQIVCIPGGFSYGDDIAAGRILANAIMAKVADELRAFRDAGNLILGICNGFQVLIKSGLLIEASPNGFEATLAWNRSGRFEDRWVHLSSGQSKCVFLQGVESLYLPVAHAEGRFVVNDENVFTRLSANGQVALCYSLAAASASAKQFATAAVNSGASNWGSEHALPCGVSDPYEILPFPHNPNGSMGNVAGLCDLTGRVFGLMPHPERFMDRTQHPHWTRLKEDNVGDGRMIFENAVRAFD
ncbi:MAG TPA: phosphoribosylformylglycinamidine synthase subunit PurQ [Pirellulaceae bacterium]|nr:phosphoribosylformylglycinamidine synthase subunit PurQ [Pirellulaceae bacterium]HMO92616.1 phosphoribosylformylglycinamidine synthase subunit PurQ [Pirellulaceae bacterium]HMP70691.1 phosphoribosylformylglycinamidine synthase subunit PurQ [Pirellulaceae bacterium]